MSSFSSVCPAAARLPSSATRAANGSKSSMNGLCSSTRAQKRSTLDSSSSSGRSQLVLSLASRIALRMYIARRSRSIGQAPTSVW